MHVSSETAPGVSLSDPSCWLAWQAVYICQLSTIFGGLVSPLQNEQVEPVNGLARSTDLRRPLHRSSKRFAMTDVAPGTSR